MYMWVHGWHQYWGFMWVNSGYQLGIGDWCELQHNHHANVHGKSLKSQSPESFAYTVDISNHSAVKCQSRLLLWICMPVNIMPLPRRLDGDCACQLVHSPHALTRMGWCCLCIAKISSKCGQSWPRLCWLLSVHDLENHSVLQYSLKVHHVGGQPGSSRAQPASRSRPAAALESEYVWSSLEDTS